MEIANNDFPVPIGNLVLQISLYLDLFQRVLLLTFSFSQILKWMRCLKILNKPKYLSECQYGIRVRMSDYHWGDPV